MSAASSLTRALREVAPRLCPRLFPSRCPLLQSHHLQCEAQAAFRRVSTPTPTSSSSFRSLSTWRTVPCTSILNRASVRTIRRTFTTTRAASTEAVTATATATATVTKTLSPPPPPPPRRSRWPTTSSNSVAYFLLFSAASVFGIVIFGGLTRLTESGLSITEWRPVTGSLPPMSQEDWEREFRKYQSSPEFQVLNSRMTLEEFKSIYWMEWIHRLWGRAIGVGFVLPAIYFVARRQVSKRMAVRLLAIAGMIGFQGFLGWWMVKSGLKDDLFAPGSHPRVSQYRLTAHLGAAFVVYLTMLHSGLSILRTNRLLSLPTATAQSTISALAKPALRPFRLLTTLFCALVFTTAMSGALVAGLDAGLIYNEFPFMGLGLTPPKSELFDKWYSHVAADEHGNHADLVWRNMCENPSLVQLDHRILATTVFTYAHALWAYTKFSPTMQQVLPHAAKRAVHGVLGFAWLQVVLGISTLLYLVPTPLASMHQAGALLLLTWSFVLGGRVWLPRYATRVLQQRLQAGYPTAAAAAPQTAKAASSGPANTTTTTTTTTAPGMAMAALPAAAFAGWMLTAPHPQPASLPAVPDQQEQENIMADDDDALASSSLSPELEFLQKQSKAWLRHRPEGEGEG